MDKRKLTSEFGKWLIENSAIGLMRSCDFAEYEIDRLMKSEAPGKTMFENEYVFVGVYAYEFFIQESSSLDGKEHRFSFDAIGIGSKQNVTEQDYELSDYTAHTFIIK